MKETGTVIHTAHRDKNRHFYFLMLLLPSIVFVVVLAFFLRNRYSPVETITKTEVAISLTPIVVKDTTVNVRLAKTPVEQEQGLSGVANLAADEGMLFVFPSASRTPFWMKDMLIPLDFIWIKDGKVTQIHKNVAFPAEGTPNEKLSLYVPNDPVDSVLEVNAGFADLHNILVGDSVQVPN